MKLPLSLLREYVTTPLNAQEIGDLLTMAGFELEDLTGEDESAVLDVKVMANRGDGLSAFGLAREILAKDPGAKPTDLYSKVSGRFDNATAGTSDRVTIETETCSRYACLVYESVVQQASPKWLEERLTQAGQRSISLVVDLTNYVMLELGQPLHAFDLDQLSGQKIVVRQAKSGEKLTTLNGVEHELKSHHMMICDSDKPVAAAGVMGGAETEFSDSTKRMLIESAHFNNSSVRKTRKELGLNTEASYRFERSVDPEGVLAALYRFAELYSQISGAPAPNEIIDLYPAKPKQVTIALRPARARKLWGMEILDNEMLTILQKLGFGVTPNSDTFEVIVPTWRPDVTLEEDVIEEIGRVYGYEHIPELLPQGTTPRGGVFGVTSIIDTAKKTMLRCGLDQVISHTMRDAHRLDFNPDRRVSVRNPHSPELQYLRSSLLPSLADAALRNGGKNVRLFEIGKVFVQGEYVIDESPELSILVTGDMQDQHFAQKASPQADFWTVKGIIEELGKLVGDDVQFALPRLPDHRFHPTRQAGIMVDSGRLWVGTVGQIDPDYAIEIGLPTETYMAEMDLLVFFQNPNTEVKLRQISRNPAVRRDIAFVIPTQVPYSEVESTIRAAAGPVLETVNLFDVYSGKGIEEGFHSLAISMQFRKMGENYTDAEANELRDKIVAAIQEIGGVLR